MRDGAGLMAGPDPQAAMEMLVDAAEAAEYAGDGAAMIAVAGQARQVAAQSAATAPGASLLTGMADMISGQTEQGSAAISAALDQVAGTSSAQWLRWAGHASLYQGDSGRSIQLLGAAARLARSDRRAGRTARGPGQRRDSGAAARTVHRRRGGRRRSTAPGQGNRPEDGRGSQPEYARLRSGVPW